MKRGVTGPASSRETGSSAVSGCHSLARCPRAVRAADPSCFFHEFTTPGEGKRLNGKISPEKMARATAAISVLWYQTGTKDQFCSPLGGIRKGGSYFFCVWRSQSGLVV